MSIIHFILNGCILFVDVSYHYNGIVFLQLITFRGTFLVIDVTPSTFGRSNSSYEACNSDRANSTRDKKKKIEINRIGNRYYGLRVFWIRVHVCMLNLYRYSRRYRLVCRIRNRLGVGGIVSRAYVRRTHLIFRAKTRRQHVKTPARISCGSHATARAAAPVPV